MKKYLVVYHFEDNDGVVSAAMVIDHLIKNGTDRKNIDILPANYNILSEIVDKGKFEEVFAGYDSIIMTDISFNDWHQMVRVRDITPKFIWVDHHKPIIDTSFAQKFDDIDGIRDTTRSAILNMYKYLYDPFDAEYNNGEVPILLRYLSAYDSWSYDREKLDFERCRYVNEGVNLEYGLNLEYVVNEFELFLETKSEEMNFFKEILANGEASIRKKDEFNAALIERAGEPGWTVAGKRSAIMLVTSGGTNSVMFKSVKDKYDNAIVFKHEANGNWIVSMYNINDDHGFHCGEYLKEKYNGGGHEGAAGCTIKDLDVLFNMFKTKSI